MPILLEYEPRDTPVHRLHVMTKVTLEVCVLLLAAFWWDLRFLGPLLLFALILAALAKVPLRWYKAFAIPVLLVLPPTFAYAIFVTNPRFFAVLPEEFTSKPILIILPEKYSPWGSSVALTYGNLYYIISTVFKLFTALTITFVFVYTTPMNDLLEWLKKLGAPSSALFVTTAAWRFIPLMLRQTSKTLTAQQLRGWELKTKNPVKAVKQFTPVVRPLIFYSVNMVDRVTMAVVTRALGASTKPTGYARIPKARAIDYLITIPTVAFTMVAITLLLIYNIGAI